MINLLSFFFSLGRRFLCISRLGRKTGLQQRVSELPDGVGKVDHERPEGCFGKRALNVRRKSPFFLQYSLVTRDVKRIIQALSFIRDVLQPHRASAHFTCSLREWEVSCADRRAARVDLALRVCAAVLKVP